MTHIKSRISNLILPVSKKNPSVFPANVFTYVDINSVDASQKRITDPKIIPCSSAPSRARQLLQSEDILVSTVRPNLNCVAYVPCELDGAIASTGFCVLRPDNQSLNSRYLYHWVQTRAFIGEMISKATGASYPAVSDSIIHASEIPLPPLEEQRRIAAILDKADELEKLSKSAIEFFHQALSSSFNSLTISTSKGCYSKKLENIVSAIIDYRGKSPEKTDKGVPLITAQLIKEGRILKATEFIAHEHYSEWMRRGLPERGDVIFTTEAPLGQVAQIDNPDVALAQRLVLLRGKSNLIDNTYLRFALRMNYVTRQIRKRATGSTVLGIRQKELRQIEIPLPSISEQRIFARLALAIEEKIQQLRKRGEVVKALRSALASQFMKA